MNEVLSESVYFGAALSISAYWLAFQIKKKWDYPVMNPLLLATLMIMGVLALFNINYETFDYGAKYITYLLTPATVCLAVPLYKQVLVLKKNIAAVFAGIVCGCLTHALVVAGIAFLLKADGVLLLSLLPKSVTTPIALGISGEIGGISAVTILGVVLAGILGAVIGPVLLKLLGVREPAAQGLALGTASHVIGTTKAVEMGEIQAAMSSLAIVVTGLLTVVFVPAVAGVLL